MPACGKQSTEEAIVAAIARYLDRDPDELSGSLLLEDDLGLDAVLGRPGLAFVLEERFGVTIDERAYNSWIVVDDVMHSLSSIAGAGNA